ncbi:hypothetical protein AB0K16_19895 [Nonomuraea jabiensis]|uniref:hypothetical protein n=1 Tax=Nonomuraea jabiensis TaxID=882448 RepID=UPI003437E4D9
MIAETVSGLLDEHAVPRRDAYAVCADYCRRVVRVLSEVLGPHMLRHYTANAALRADITTLRQEGAAEVSLASGEDVDRITAALVTLGSALAETLTPMAANESLPPMMRGAARMAADAAGILWSHSGGDSGGW